MQNVICNRLPARQRGASLIISLLFLIMLTVLGLSSMNSSKLEQRMAHNYQLNTYVFQGAESAIDDAMLTGTQSFYDPAAPDTLKVNDLYVPASNLFLIALGKGQGDTTTFGTVNADPTNALKDANIAVGSIVVYNGSMACPGSSYNTVACGKYELTGRASIPGTGATATHKVGARYMMPGN